MDIRTIAILTAACSLLFSTAGAETALQATGRQTASYPLPSIKKDCDTCHLPAGTHTAGELKKNLPGLCLDCHRDRTAPAEHKIDIVPKLEVKGLPLFDGKVTCVTCHDPHANTNGNMLRMKAADLCQACHPM